LTALTGNAWGEGGKLLAVLSTLMLATACTSMDRNAQLQPRIAPLMSVNHGVPAADADYQMGRYYAARARYDEAIVAYRQALQRDPANAEAHNALGVVLARQGNYAEAERELQAALDLAPSAAHIRNNLGQLCLLQGRNAAALQWLKRAEGLDPDNQRIRDNIQIAEVRLNRDAAMPTVADTSGNAPRAVAASPARRDSVAGNVHLQSVSPQVFELVTDPPAVAVPSSPPLGPEQKTARLEVSNGNGVTGLARRTAAYLRGRGYTTARLTNQIPFTQAVTEIQYRQGHEEQARQLKAALSLPARIVQSQQLNTTIAVRMVLGRDAAQRPVFADAETGGERHG
jgi:tetratricopeptide (TPR) repeat protein